ncbi:GGDEF domain-containing protein [Cohnella kolymensis]|uniref:GGDEF domain-containing protein n=1 Tax=Cohnella kolymensis TaxID=1590652 RepID=UPI000698CD8A|nr:GGDEF domain-containing protein [Cohnella kolymensis]
MPDSTFAPDRLGLLFSSAVAVVIVGLMLFMSYRLLHSNRRQAYRSLLVSLIFILIHHLLQLTLALGLTPAESFLNFGGKLLQVYAFIVINFAIFELYHRRRPRTRLWFYGLLTTGLLIAMGESLPGASTPGASWANSLQTTPALDGYLLMLAPLFVLMFAPHIGQPRKYLASLAAATVMQISVIAGTYWIPDSKLLATLSVLMPVIYYLLLFILLFERVVELLQSVYRSSITDGLTNLYNRRYFSARLEQALHTGRPLGVIFCDIDNFKRLNDSHGHHKADGVLKQIASILMEETEGVGLAGRYGGEELVAFLIGPGLSSLQAAETIRSRTEKESIVTVSIGFCMAEPDVSAEALLKRADQAMYHSKTTGKNRVTDYAEIAREQEPHKTDSSAESGYGRSRRNI